MVHFSTPFLYLSRHMFALALSTAECSPWVIIWKPVWSRVSPDVINCPRSQNLSTFWPSRWETTRSFSLLRSVFVTTSNVTLLPFLLDTSHCLICQSSTIFLHRILVHRRKHHNMVLDLHQTLQSTVNQKPKALLVVFTWIAARFCKEPCSHGRFYYCSYLRMMSYHFFVPFWHQKSLQSQLIHGQTAFLCESLSGLLRFHIYELFLEFELNWEQSLYCLLFS